MTNNISALITAAGVLVFYNGEQHVVGNDHPNFTRIKDAVKFNRLSEIPALADLTTTVRRWLSSGQDFELVNDCIAYKGESFSPEITNKVLNMIDAGNSADPLFNFLRKVRNNPSKTAQDELLLFCVANGFMIHEDGDIIAYKSVRGNYTDIHSGKFRNAVGDVVTMPRHQVDDNRERTCSTGLHFAAFDYASTWAGTIDGVTRRLMVMKINPADVVSVPNDYANQKGRCARYEVIAEITKTASPLPKKEVYSTQDFTPVKPKVDVAKLQGQIDRKRSLIDRYEQELTQLNETIEQIETLGGLAAEEQLDRIDQLNEYIDIVNDEINVLEIKIANA